MFMVTGGAVLLSFMGCRRIDASDTPCMRGWQWGNGRSVPASHKMAMVLHHHVSVLCMEGVLCMELCVVACCCMLLLCALQVRLVTVAAGGGLGATVCLSIGPSTT